MEKIICAACGIEKEINDHYYHNTRMDICKDCFKEEMVETNNVYATFKKYDTPFILDLWEVSEREVGNGSYFTIDQYMKNLNLPQFRGLRWKDSKLDKNTSGFELSFDREVILNLKDEVKSLTSKIKSAREREDFGTYKNLILAYKEVLKLLQDTERNIKWEEKNKKEKDMTRNFDVVDTGGNKKEVRINIYNLLKSLKEKMNGFSKEEQIEQAKDFIGLNYAYDLLFLLDHLDEVQ